MWHLTLRAAWHDRRWNGRVCAAPSRNSFCVALDRIRGERDDVQEEAVAGTPWGLLDPAELPACKAESGGFMNDAPWRRRFVHPYAGNDKTSRTHGRLQPTGLLVPEFSTFAVPFAWMLRENQRRLDESQPTPLPPDEGAPFPTPWIFGAARQEAVLNLFFDQLTPEHSLVFFYCKEGQPLGESYPRLVAGVGRILSVGPLLRYDSREADTYPFWDRVIRHSVRPDGIDGFLLPYHDYLEPTGSDAEDARRRELLEEIAVGVDPTQTRRFSYAAELAGAEVALTTLVQCLEAVRKIREHGIASGPWERREEWLNAQIALAWRDRGAFPGLGSALEALGMRLGTALYLELRASGRIEETDDPWAVVEPILKGAAEPPQDAYRADLRAVRPSWLALSEEQKQLLQLLSRFDLSPAQSRRWWDPAQRAKTVQEQIPDAAILANPYLISERDAGDAGELPISMSTIDRGLLPDSTLSTRFPAPAPSLVESHLDPRRVRAAAVSVLRRAAEDGDSLLSVTEAIERIAALPLPHPCAVGSGWFDANEAGLEGALERVQVVSDAAEGGSIAAVQLSDLRTREQRLAKILKTRAARSITSLEVIWPDLLMAALARQGVQPDPANSRHAAALAEQAQVLERLTTCKLSVLVGRAGTGKTSVLGALLECRALVADGLLFLAPTGKARVRLGAATGAEAMTIAQFLNSVGRYDGARQRPLFKGGEPYRNEKTVVIDECSMVAMDDLVAVLQALDQAHVQRIILVGDPNQLPPIGVGRPFADLVATLDGAALSDSEGAQQLGRALGRLTVELRTSSGKPSDTLRLAAWFTREAAPVDADRALSDLELGESFNDLEIYYWKTPEQLRASLLDALVKHLELSGPQDVEGFNRSLGMDDNGLVPFSSPDGAANFQILSPVRLHSHGVYDLNRWIQRHFRRDELKRASSKRGLSLGDEQLVLRDKVIQTRNERRRGYDRLKSSEADVYLANGEIGILASGKGPFLNVAFAGRPQLTVGYRRTDFSEGQGPLQLAYVLTVHKSQGSEFRKVFVVLPAQCRLSRELVYTALTRSKDQMVLLIEGDNASTLYELSRPERSETTRRNTNLFRGAVRERIDTTPFAEHLIHRTEKGHMVRSKSELVIANMLHRMGLEYQYERLLEGTTRAGRLRPDFSFIDAAGDVVIWEHLGMLSREDYRVGWEWKRAWYAENCYREGETLFTSQDDERGGLDSDAIRQVAEKIRDLVE